MNIIDINLFLSKEILLDYNCIYKKNNTIIEFDIIKDKIEDKIEVIKKYKPIYIDDSLFNSVTTLKISEFGKYKVYSGQGDGHGSSGFLVFCENNILNWFLFCDTSNPFYEISFQDDFIICYTNNNKAWKIKVMHPEEIIINGFDKPLLIKS